MGLVSLISEDFKVQFRVRVFYLQLYYTALEFLVALLVAKWLVVLIMLVKL
uniref:Uncharacterized protein n=1 Tax=Rhizophora mucronata TaxID=61149 RepID=A0A2P2IJH8_RHIMU